MKGFLYSSVEFFLEGFDQHVEGFVYDVSDVHVEMGWLGPGQFEDLDDVEVAEAEGGFWVSH